MAKGYLRSDLVVSLSITYATSNPPMKKKTSTEKSPASMNKKKGFRKDNFSTDVETLVVAPIMDVNICPMTTHIMARDLTPFNTFKSESGLRLNIFTVY